MRIHVQNRGQKSDVLESDVRNFDSDDSETLSAMDGELDTPLRQYQQRKKAKRIRNKNGRPRCARLLRVCV